MHVIRSRPSRPRLVIGPLVVALLTAVVGVGTAAPALADVGTNPSNVGADSSWLTAGGFTLQPGQSIQSARAKLTFQTDGNLVVYDEHDQPRWSSRTYGRGATGADFQTDGNLVVYNGSTPLWGSGTGGHPGSALAVQDDGNVVIYPHALWATSTNHSSQDLQYAYAYVLAYPPQPGSKPVAKMANRNFSAYFPFSGCGSVLSVGQVCTLGGGAPGGGPIRIIGLTPASFTFVSLPGHPEGANRLITFTFVTDSLTKRLYLTVWARGVWTAVAEATRDSGTANGIWQQYADNLAAGIARGDWKNY
jgi:hypothetical protein